MQTALSEVHSIHKTLKHTETSPRVCIADCKPPIRKALRKIFEEFGWIACECEKASRIRAAIRANDPQVVFVGVSKGAIEAVDMLESMAASQFKKKVVLFGPSEDLPRKKIQRIGTKLGLEMLPFLETPIDNESLQKRIAAPLMDREPSISVCVAEALNAGWVELWYQPVFNAQTLQIAGVEGLARVRHPTWGILSPASFLPEKGDPYFRVFSDFIGTQVFEDWNNIFREYDGLRIAINLPMDYFQEPKSVALLKQGLLDNPGVAELIVEIDACDLIRDVNEAKAIARRLKRCRISTSIDDITSEWRALTSISDFPFAELKVDRKLIAGCADDHLKRSACREIMDFAHKFKVRTVAEGIERRSDFFAACELGFDLVQGFLFGRPMSVREFATNRAESPPLVPML
jgi:EAL domain-containing protein (putative c-di-GMP-specific phosphodiesterase class I)